MSEDAPHIPPSQPTPKKYGGRNEILSRSGKLAEVDIDIDGVTYIVRELTGLEYAKMIALHAKARMHNDVAIEAYQRNMLLAGVVDPESPEGAREPAFVQADMDAVMECGAGFLEPLIEGIEELSGLSAKAKEIAEKQLGEAPSTSDSPES